LKVLEDLGYAQPKEEDIQLLKQICQVMSERAARLASAGLAAIVKVNIIKDLWNNISGYML
jgi:hexokinase